MIEGVTRDDLASDWSWRQLETTLRPFLGRRVPAGDVDDLVQEVFLRMQGGLQTLQSDDRFGAWVYQIARNVVTDHFRKRRRVMPPTEQLADAVHPEEHDDDRQAEREVAAYARLFVAMLKEPYREALTLTELQGMTQREAAEHVGISVSGMKSRVQRGRRELRGALEDCCTIALDSRQRVVGVQPREDGTLPDGCCE